MRNKRGPRSVDEVSGSAGRGAPVRCPNAVRRYLTLGQCRRTMVRTCDAARGSRLREGDEGELMRKIRWISLVLVASTALVAAACTTPPSGGGGSTTTTTVDSGPPVAVASASPTVGDAPYTVFFDSAGSTPGHGHRPDLLVGLRRRQPRGLRRRPPRTSTRPSVSSPPS